MQGINYLCFKNKVLIILYIICLKKYFIYFEKQYFIYLMIYTFYGIYFIF